MPKFTIEIEGIRGDAVERFAALANKNAEELILEWIKDKLDHVTVQALRAEGMSWEAIAEALGNSTTQARRIYAQGLDMPLVSKETIRTLERYVNLIEQAADVELPVPTDEDLDKIRGYTDLLPAFEDKYPFPVPTDEDLDKIREYTDLLPAFEDNDPFPVPTDEDFDRMREYQKLVPSD
jgi:hypothetical protein